MMMTLLLCICFLLFITQNNCTLSNRNNGIKLPANEIVNDMYRRFTIPTHTSLKKDMSAIKIANSTRKRTRDDVGTQLIPLTEFIAEKCPMFTINPVLYNCLQTGCEVGESCKSNTTQGQVCCQHRLRNLPVTCCIEKKQHFREMVANIKYECPTMEVPPKHHCLEVGCNEGDRCTTNGMQEKICCPHTVHRNVMTTCCLADPVMADFEKDKVDPTAVLECPSSPIKDPVHCAEIGCKTGSRCITKPYQGHPCCPHEITATSTIVNCCMIKNPGHPSESHEAKESFTQFGVQTYINGLKQQYIQNTDIKHSNMVTEPTTKSSIRTTSESTIMFVESTQTQKADNDRCVDEKTLNSLSGWQRTTQAFANLMMCPEQNKKESQEEIKTIKDWLDSKKAVPVNKYTTSETFQRSDNSRDSQLKSYNSRLSSGSVSWSITSKPDSEERPFNRGRKVSRFLWSYTPTIKPKPQEMEQETRGARNHRYPRDHRFRRDHRFPRDFNRFQTRSHQPNQLDTLFNLGKTSPNSEYPEKHANPKGITKSVEFT